MKKILITQSNYIPWKGYFDAINFVDEVILYDDVQFTKRDWRNRNLIKTATGTKWLTIPVKVKGKYLQKINETETLNHDWALNHWNNINLNYSNAQYFPDYKNIFESLYSTIDKSLISEINFEFILQICKLLNIHTNFRWSDEFDLIQGKTEKLLHICKQAGATDYYSGPSAKDYLNEELFKKEGISVHYFNFSGYKEYHQLYGEFTHYVSIIDLIFNEGPESINYIKSFKKELHEDFTGN